MFNTMFNMIDLSDSIKKEIDSIPSIFDSAFDDAFSMPKFISYPINIYEYDNKLEFEFAAVGKTIDDIDIAIEDSNLHIKTKEISEVPEKESIKNENVKCLLHKLKKAKFDFIYQLGGQYEIDKITAKMNNGLLVVSIPKKEKKVKKIEISVK